MAGQVIHVKRGPLKAITSIDRVVQADPPFDGQTIFARIVFLGKEGESIARWFRDAEHHHIQTQSEVNHPWCTITEQTDLWCLARDTTSCVVVYSEQSEMTFRVVPRWLTRQLDNDKTVRKTTAEVREAFLQSMKAKAEQMGSSEKRSV